MRLRSPLTAAAVVCALALAGCGRAEQNEKAVATPTLTLAAKDAAVGSPMDMTYRFVVAPDAPPFAEDYWVFVHFLDADGELMWTDDHQPPTPTRQWKPGATIEYTRTMFLPKFPYVGDTRIEMGIFSPKSGTRLPLAGQSRGQRAIMVANFNLKLQSDNLFVVFRDGWHETEVGDEASGIEWQWSRKEGTLSFRNPKRDVVFLLQVDDPVAALPDPQHVDVRVGDMVVDSFTVTPGAPKTLRRINITAAQLGTGDTVEMTLAVDKTFVPASVAALRSTDSRELGIRVFRAFVQPKT
jgi:hypothetical protein